MPWRSLDGGPLDRGERAVGVVRLLEGDLMGGQKALHLLLGRPVRKLPLGQAGGAADRLRPVRDAHRSQLSPDGSPNAWAAWVRRPIALAAASAAALTAASFTSYTSE